MSDEKKIENEKQEIENKANDAHIVRLQAIKAVRELSNPNSPWTLTQEILQEILATHIVVNPDKIPPTTLLIDQLKEEIERRYKDEEELKVLLLTSIPSQPISIRNWMKKEGWKDAVWSKIKNTGLFTEARRAQMINALFERGVSKDTVAAKIWLTLSGDYQEKMDINSDKTIDAFREINSILYKKSREEK